MAKDGKALYVEWDDSVSVGSRVWVHDDDVLASKPSRCKSIGFVFKESTSFLTLVGHLDGSSYTSGNMTIPKSAIRIRRRVALPKR